mgnify:CR=1 FL=1
MKVLVTGVTDFVDRALVDSLIIVWSQFIIQPKLHRFLSILYGNSGSRCDNESPESENVREGLSL